MTYPTTKPYQSRILSFVSKQKNRLLDRINSSIRHLKVASQWGLELLIYPFYALIQYIISPQAKFTPPPSVEEVPLLNSSDSDQVFKEVFVAIQKIKINSDLIVVEKQESAMTIAKPVVRSIATLIDNKYLVLVSSDNELLEILTLEQQQDLRELIFKLTQSKKPLISINQPNSIPQLIPDQLILEVDYPIESIETVNQVLPSTKDWIDTTFVSLGYVKHPLEIVLGWLDQFLVWVEKLIAGIWRFILRYVLI